MKRWIMMSLLLAHVAWVAVHAALVQHEWIDPWKLGGYAMYTVPAPCPSVATRRLDAPAGGSEYVHVGLEAEDAFIRELQGACLNDLDEGYRRLSEVYPAAREEALLLEFKQRVMDESKGLSVYRDSGTAQLSWSGDTLVVVEERCGRTRPLRYPLPARAS